MKTYLLLNPLLFYFVFGIIFYFRKPDQKIKAIYFGSLLTLFFAAVILRFQFIPHYLFALAFYLFFNAIVILLSFKQSFLKVTLIISFILLELIYFPRQQYFASWRSPERFEKAVAFVINKNLVSKTNFNVLQITQENLLATIGYEYRYFFRKNGYLADSEFLYSHSKELVVFSEVFYKNINQFNSWEAEQFGKKYFKNPQRYQLPGLTIFVLQKGREGEIEN